MNELRQQIIDVVLAPGFSPWTHKSYQAVISKTIVTRRIRHEIGLLLAGSARNVTEAEGQLLGESTSSRTQCCEAPRQPNGSIREWPFLAGCRQKMLAYFIPLRIT